ncbi:hypothetical protein V8F20_012022 [Naviculisporaceae sp. PSN 640]
MRFNLSHSTDSLGSRRPARAALPPFTLPPPPEIPRAGGFAADGLSPATGGVRSTGESSSHSTSTSALSSPGYSVAAMSSFGSPRQGSHTPYSSQHPSVPRFQGSPGRLQQPLAPKPPPPNHPIQPQLSPGLPLTSSSASSGYGEKLPPISSLIPRSPMEPMHPSHYPGSGPGRPPIPSSGHLARPVGAPLVTTTPGAPGNQPAFYRVPPNAGRSSQSAPAPTHHYLEFNVGMGAYSVVRESSQQDRPFKCDICTQCFSRNHDLKRHKRIHLAAKPFPCPQCQKCFSRKDALKRHSLVKACGGKKKKGLAGAEENDADQDEEMQEARIGSGSGGQLGQQSPESKSPSPTASTLSSADNIETDAAGKASTQSRIADQINTGTRKSNGDEGGGGTTGVPGG